MQSLRLRITRIIYFGIIVTLVGTDSETGKPVTLHVDHRPTSSFWEAWRQADCAQPIEYEADRVLLHLDMLPAEEGGDAQLVELDRSDPALVTQPTSVRELDQ
jgi:hypothetical protein